MKSPGSIRLGRNGQELRHSDGFAGEFGEPGGADRGFCWSTKPCLVLRVLCSSVGVGWQLSLAQILTDLGSPITSNVLG